LNAEILSAGFYHGGGTFCPPALANNFLGAIAGLNPISCGGWSFTVEVSQSWCVIHFELIVV
jgi:hypothetical protein